MKDAAKTGWMIEVGDADFEQEVLNRSRQVPVVVDFWAEWCEPCRQLSPLLEKMAVERRGKFVLAKVNIEEAQRLAMYFRIESIPAVLAFRGGQAVNGFVGLLPERELKEFIDDLAGPAATDPLVQAAAMEEKYPVKAEEIYRGVLAADDGHQSARLGLARIFVATSRDDEALKVLEPIPDIGEAGAEAVRLRRTVEMRKAAATAGDEAELKKKIASDPANAKLWLELGNVLGTKGQYQPALDALLKAAELDRDLGRGPVRELMVKIFEIIGVRSEVADQSRDKLRALLY